MSGTKPNSRVIPLPFRTPFRTETGWSRTWNVSMCAPFADESLLALRDSLTRAGFDLSIEYSGMAELDVTIHYGTNDDPFSDTNFVVRPREMLRVVEGCLGRIGLIEGVARTLWPPFRPQFSTLVTSSISPALILDRFVRNLLAQEEWERGRIVLPNGQEAVQPGAVDFAKVRELGFKRSMADLTPEIQVVVFNDDLVLLAAEDSNSFREECARLESLIDDQFDFGMALAS